MFVAIYDPRFCAAFPTYSHALHFTAVFIAVDIIVVSRFQLRFGTDPRYRFFDRKIFSRRVADRDERVTLARYFLN